MQLNITSLQTGLTFRGEVSAVRQTYHIFEGQDFFFVLSLSRSKKDAGNFNVVDKRAVQYVQSRFAGKKGVTSNAVVDRSRRTHHAKNALAALNILYVLVALGVANIEKGRMGSHQQLFFSVRNSRSQ